MVNGGLEGQVGKDYVSSELALPCRRIGWAGPPAGHLLGATEGAFAGGGGLRANPTENKVGWRSAWEAGCASLFAKGATAPALFLCSDRRARGPFVAWRYGAAQCSTTRGWGGGRGLKGRSGSKGGPARVGSAQAGKNAAAIGV